MPSYSYQYFVFPSFVAVVLLTPSYYFYQNHFSDAKVTASGPGHVRVPVIERTFWPPKQGPPPEVWDKPSHPWPESSMRHPSISGPPLNEPDYPESPNDEDPTKLKNFPPTIAVNFTEYENWAGDIATNVWTAYPENAYDIIELANWARLNHYRLRPSGYRSSWSPLTVSLKEVTQHRVIVVDTTAHLNNIQVDLEAGTFWAEPGITLEQVLSQLEENNLGLASFPSFGEMSLGGILATGSHGVGLPSLKMEKPKGHSFASMSNLITSLTAIIYDRDLNAFALKTFNRSNPEMRAFLVNFGTTFITNITMKAGPLIKLQYKSQQVKPEELFSSPLNKSIKSFLDNVDEYGRVLGIFSSENIASLRTWTVAEAKPDGDTEVESLTFSQGDNSEGTAWGTGKSVLLYSNPEQKVSNGGWAIITNRTNIQRVVHEFYHHFNHTVNQYRKYHPNFTISFEVKVTGLDEPEDVGIEEAVTSAFSPLQPIHKRQDLNCSVWINLVSSVVFTSFDAQVTNEFFHVIENFILDNFNSYWSVVRVEWTSGWSFTKTSPWLKLGLTRDLKKLGAFSDWNYAVGVIQKYDPFAVFADSFVSEILID